VTIELETIQVKEAAPTETRNNNATLTKSEETGAAPAAEAADIRLANLTNKLLNNLISEEMNSSNTGPVDCSFKSRALYESFRGKPSTLERPRQKKQLSNQLSLDQHNKFFSTPRAPSKERINKRISYDDLNDSTGQNHVQGESCRVVVRAVASEQNLPDKKKVHWSGN